MVRRTILMVGIIVGASAAGALAFASEISRAGRHLVERATWLGRGFTPVPAPPSSVHGSGLSLPNETPKGEHCAFPPAGGPSAGAFATADTLLGASVNSPPRLVLEGQSTLPDSLPPALCTGGSPAVAPLLPPLGKQ
jgi:hypothetical protein